VLRALDELEREGRIIRRQGSGVFVAQRKANNSNGIIPTTLTDNRTIVAIAKPDSSYFDHAMRLLFGHVENAGMSLACRYLDPATSTLSLPADDAVKPRGYIVFRQDLLPLARQLQDAGNRVVMVGTPYVDQTPEVPNVYSDHQKGGSLAAGPSSHSTLRNPRCHKVAALERPRESDCRRAPQGSGNGIKCVVFG
jgi:hypothetical protein